MAYMFETRNRYLCTQLSFFFQSRYLTTEQHPAKMQGESRLNTAALDALAGTEAKSKKKDARPISSRRQKSKAAWDPSWPAQPDHGGSDGEARSDTSESDSEDLIGEARLDRLALELKDLPVSTLYPEIAAAGLEVSPLD